MNIGILNSELGIVVVDSLIDLGHIHIEQIKKQLPEGVNVNNDLVFYYMEDRDWIVLNKSHVFYEVYLKIIETYLVLTDEGRQKARETAPTEKILDGLNILEDIIRRRTLIFGGVLIDTCF